MHTQKQQRHQQPLPPQQRHSAAMLLPRLGSGQSARLAQSSPARQQEQPALQAAWLQQQGLQACWLTCTAR
jgi:hypothetical protein